MRIMFDVSGTVLGIIDLSLRPGIKMTIDGLRQNGMEVDFWTSGPVDYYSSLLARSGLSGVVYKKREPLPFTPDICVDDDPDDWFAAKTYRVAPHLGADMPGDVILVAEVLQGQCGENFYWD